MLDFTFELEYELMEYMESGHYASFLIPTRFWGFCAA